MEGRCSFVTEVYGRGHPRAIMLSGDCFNLALFSVFGVYLGFDNKGVGGDFFEVWADTDCLLYCWSLADLDEMASLGPVSAFWRNFILYTGEAARARSLLQHQTRATQDSDTA